MPWSFELVGPGIGIASAESVGGAMDHVGLQVRLASNRDEAPIRHFIESIRREHGVRISRNREMDLNDITASYDAAGGFLVVVEAREILATAGFFPVSETTGELRKFYVARRARGLGLGKLLLQFVIRAAVREGYHYLELETYPEFETANRLYQQMGFEEIRGEGPGLASHADPIYLRLDLAAHRRRLG